MIQRKGAPIFFTPNVSYSLALKKIFLLLLFIGFGNSNVFAEDKPVGQIIGVVGSIQYRTAQTPVAKSKDGSKVQKVSFSPWKKVKFRQKIYATDEIRTAKNSRLKIKFNDNSLIALGPNAKMEVERYLFQKEEKLRQGVVKVSQGLSMYIFNKSQNNKKSSFVIKSPSGNLVARGTHGYVAVTADRTLIGNRAGAVLTTSSDPNVKGRVRVGAMQKTVIQKGKPPTRAVRMSRAEVNLFDTLVTGSNSAAFKGKKGKKSLIEVEETEDEKEEEEKKEKKEKKSKKAKKSKNDDKSSDDDSSDDSKESKKDSDKKDKKSDKKDSDESADSSDDKSDGKKGGSKDSEDTADSDDKKSDSKSAKKDSGESKDSSDSGDKSTGTDDSTSADASSDSSSSDSSDTSADSSDTSSDSNSGTDSDPNSGTESSNDSVDTGDSGSETIADTGTDSSPTGGDDTGNTGGADIGGVDTGPDTTVAATDSGGDLGGLGGDLGGPIGGGDTTGNIDTGGDLGGLGADIGGDFTTALAQDFGGDTTFGAPADFVEVNQPFSAEVVSACSN